LAVFLEGAFTQTEKSSFCVPLFAAPFFAKNMPSFHVNEPIYTTIALLFDVFA
jgi:hypothetical protein